MKVMVVSTLPPLHIWPRGWCDDGETRTLRVRTP